MPRPPRVSYLGNRGDVTPRARLNGLAQWPGSTAWLRMSAHADRRDTPACAGVADRLILLCSSIGGVQGSAVGDRTPLHRRRAAIGPNRPPAVSRRIEARCDAQSPLEHVEGEAGLIQHAALIPGWLEGELDAHLANAWHRADRVLDPLRHVAGDRAARSGERHLHGDVAIVVDVDLVDQAQ